MQENLCLEHSVVLKIAKANDLPDVFELVDAYDDGRIIDKTITKNSLREIVYDQGVLLVEYDETVIGGIAGYVMPSMFTRDIIFSVMFFYVRPQFRFLTKKILKELELSMLPTIANKIVFGVDLDGGKNASKMLRYYRMAGYKPLETHVYKRMA